MRREIKITNSEPKPQKKIEQKVDQKPVEVPAPQIKLPHAPVLEDTQHNKQVKTGDQHQQIKEQEQVKQQKDDLAIDQEKNRYLSLKSNQEIKNQVKRWKKMSEILQKKRQIQFELYKQKAVLEKEKQSKEQKQKLDAQLQAKREEIKKRLQQAELRRIKRQQQLLNEKKSRKKQQSLDKKEPLYQEKQKQFHLKKLNQEARIRQNILKKKQEMMIDMEKLKEHQQKFINHIKQRHKKKTKSKKKRTSENTQKVEGLGKRTKSQFNIFVNADPVQKQKDLEKYVRRKKFEEKVKQMPVLIDEQKMKEALIARDKAKNPLKYNYLSSVAALSDSKIYQQFKDFQININQRELGNDYMRQVHNQIPMSSRVKSQSQSRLKSTERPEYKNYLPDVKSLLKRRPQNGQPNDEVQEIMYRYESNSERLAELNRKSELYKNQVIKKIGQIKDNGSSTAAYSDYISKEKVIDDLYMKSIKLKIATAHIND